MCHPLPGVIASISRYLQRQLGPQRRLVPFVGPTGWLPYSAVLCCAGVEVSVVIAGFLLVPIRQSSPSLTCAMPVLGY